MPRYGMASAAKLLSSASHGLAAIGPDLRTNPTFSGHVRPVFRMDTPGSAHSRYSRPLNELDRSCGLVGLKECLTLLHRPTLRQHVQV
ncbi:hypothetical protein BD309DRAFT_951108 [Dichomitus squalens]|nr:hypothetical protein BD309DRAFT_951108 [Dichomitus squalens]